MKPMQDKSNQHITHEQISAFIYHTLDKKEHYVVLEHLRGCESCRVLMAESALFLKEEQADKPRQSVMFLRHLRPYALAVDAGLLLFIIPFYNLKDQTPMSQNIAMQAPSVELLDEVTQEVEEETVSRVM
jgi:hypothetical protein